METVTQNKIKELTLNQDGFRAFFEALEPTLDDLELIILEQLATEYPNSIKLTELVEFGIDKDDVLKAYQQLQARGLAV